jgi:hypothetical protein
MFCRGIEQNDTPVVRIVGHLHVASDRFPSEWCGKPYLGIPSRLPVTRAMTCQAAYQRRMGK